MNTGTLANDWTPITANSLPPAKRLVWIKRNNLSIYFGYRLDKPITNNPDPSRDCFWYGNPFIDGLEANNSRGWEPHCNFSDVTVLSWKLVEPT